MKANNIREYRTQLSVTQKQLAELANTSQQQIQRIETGQIAASLTTAIAISKALGKSLEDVFPGAETAVSSFKDQRTKTGHYSDEDLSKVADAGIEMDACNWTLKLYLNGRNDFYILKMNGADKRRMFRYFCEPDSSEKNTFFMFDTDTHRVALNVNEVVFHQFLFDGPLEPFQDDSEAGELDDSYNVQIILTNGGPVIGLSVDPDYTDSEDDLGQLSNLFCMLELEVDPNERCYIEDMDGEYAFIRAGSIAMLQVALDAVEPLEDDEEC